jgi:glycosyltransferase involved in cell wall biosynthesis
MKIGVISFFMMESSLPLAKHLSSLGNEVDFYGLLPHGNQQAFVFNFNNQKQSIGFVKPQVLNKILGVKLLNYMSNVTAKIYIFPDRWFQKLIFLDLFKAYFFSRRINQNKYDVIHIIHSSKRFWVFLILFLDKKKVVQTLHEVTSHEAETDFLTRLMLRSLTKYSIPVIFHSYVSKQRFLDFREVVNPRAKDQKLTVIRFGLFETYHLSHVKKSSVYNKAVKILNFGRIVPYKGIEILVDAVKILQTKYPIHLTIAGSGKAYFDFDEINHYTFINRTISNDELVGLIQECDMVVLPYTSASQSGIPMTVFCFNKPIIASNIEGFREVIEHQKTGLLVKDLNSHGLAETIEQLILEDGLMESMAENISLKYKKGEFSWLSIARTTLQFYDSIV